MHIFVIKPLAIINIVIYKLNLNIIQSNIYKWLIKNICIYKLI